MIYKLLAVNIDGTLLQSNDRYNKATKEAIEYVHSKGVTVVLFTSRSYQSCRKVAEILKINPMIVASQGGYIGTSIDKPLFVKKIHEQTTMDIIKLLEQSNCQIKLHCEELQVANRINLPENFIGKAVMFASEKKMYTQHYVDCLSEFLQKEPSRPITIEAELHSEKEQKDISKAIEHTFSDVVVVCKSNFRIIVASEGVSKWKGIQYLAEYMGINKREIVAIGDGDEDMESIIESGMGVAMGNASVEMRRNANWITRSNDEDGVAYMIKELFRKQYQLQFLEKLNLLK